MISADNKVVNGLWISPDGAPLSNLERLCIYSFCANGHDFHLWTYGDINGLPQNAPGGNVVLRDAAEILPQSKIFFRRNSLAMFADWFRWKLLYENGGWWMDMDAVCLRSLDFADDVVFFRQNARHLSNGFLKFPQAHFIAEAMANACANPRRIVPWDTGARRRKKRVRRLAFWKNAHVNQGWGESGGPAGFSLAARHFGIFQNAKPCYLTEAVEKLGFDHLFDDELNKVGIWGCILKYGYVVHFANESFRREGYDKNGAYDSDSPFEILKRRYLPELQK